MLVIGCDPGLTGALALLHQDRGLLEVADLPTCPNGTASGSMRNWLDAAALRRLLADWRQRFEFARDGVCSVIERPIPMPRLPAQTIASQFDTFGVIRAVLPGPVHLVNPAEWKRFYGFGTDKDSARRTALALHPSAPVARVRDHNRAEAVLIGHYHLRMNA